MEIKQQNRLISAITAVDRANLSVSDYQAKLDQLLGGVSMDDRTLLAAELTTRMKDWWKAQEGQEHQKPNPYAPAVHGYFYPAGGS